jgi:hypothetical protein
MQKLTHKMITVIHFAQIKYGGEVKSVGFNGPTRKALMERGLVREASGGKYELTEEGWNVDIREHAPNHPLAN